MNLEPTQDIFTRVLLRPTVPDGAGLCHLAWAATAKSLAGRVVQIYVDGHLYDAVTDATQRETWLHLDRERDTRVELLAVDASEAWRDRAADLATWSPAFVTEATLRIARDETLPIDTRVIVSVDGEDDARHPLWGAGDARVGFGGLFGDGGFGWDMATGLGHGVGAFGHGLFGADGEPWVWTRDDLPSGEHTIDLRLEDDTGRVIGALDAAQTITIDALPAPPTDLTLDEDYTLSWQ
ncbi:MAG: hypothetical protein GC159_14400 [Phycisphaera sp.]|nr:hypothetical protein [Phycisphaera sp.]